MQLTLSRWRRADEDSVRARDPPPLEVAPHRPRRVGACWCSSHLRSRLRSRRESRGERVHWSWLSEARKLLGFRCLRFVRASSSIGAPISSALALPSSCPTGRHHHPMCYLPRDAVLPRRLPHHYRLEALPCRDHRFPAVVVPPPRATPRPPPSPVFPRSLLHVGQPRHPPLAPCACNRPWQACRPVAIPDRRAAYRH